MTLIAASGGIHVDAWASKYHLVYIVWLRRLVFSSGFNFRSDFYSGSILLALIVLIRKIIIVLVLVHERPHFSFSFTKKHWPPVWPLPPNTQLFYISARMLIWPKMI